MERVYIEIGGKERQLRYDVNAVADIEAIMGGQSLIATMGNPGSLGILAIRALLWGGLKHSERGLTLQRVGVMIQDYLDKGGALNGLMGKISDAIVAAGVLKVTDDESEDLPKGEEFASCGELIRQLEPIAYGALALKPDEFGRMTFSELNLMINGYAWRRKQRDESIAMHIVTICNACGVNLKQFMTIKNILGYDPKEEKSKEKTAQKSGEQLKQELQELIQELGGD